MQACDSRSSWTCSLKAKEEYFGGNKKTISSTRLSVCRLQWLIAVFCTDIQHFRYWKYKGHEMMVLHTLKHRHLWGKPGSHLKQHSDAEWEERDKSYLSSMKITGRILSS